MIARLRILWRVPLGLVLLFGCAPRSSKPTIPCQDYPHFFVVGTYDGHSEPFMFDTGAGGTIVVENESSRRYQAQKVETVTGWSGRGQTRDTILLDEFNLGPIKKKKLEAVRVPSGAGQYSIVGMQILWDHGVYFEPAQCRVSIDVPVPTDFEMQPLVSGKWDRAYVQIDVGGEKLVAYFDTGAESSMVDGKVVHRHPEIFSWPRGGHGMRDVNDHYTSVPIRYNFSGVGLGSATLQGSIGVIDFSIFEKMREGQDFQMVLGWDVLGKLEWYLDLKNKRWGVKKG